MNKIVLIILSVFLSGSKGETIISKKDVQEEFLLGQFQRQELEQSPFSYWFNQGYSKYQPEEEHMKVIKEHISDYEIVLFMGTWCADSQLEVPKLYKILDQAGYDYANLTTIAVDPYKETPDHIEKDYDVSLVPTIIFRKDGQEVNRFVEFALETFEEDLAAIVSNKDYQNPYADF
ncbi:TlpA family protein disulfide reductase [Salegentibacter sp. F14]